MDKERFNMAHGYNLWEHATYIVQLLHLYVVSGTDPENLHCGRVQSPKPNIISQNITDVSGFSCPCYRETTNVQKTQILCVWKSKETAETTWLIVDEGDNDEHTGWNVIGGIGAVNVGWS